MKKIIKHILLWGLFILILPMHSLSAQTFTEVIGDGWGSGMSSSKPAIYDIDGDGLFDLLVGEREGNINHFEQVDSLSFEINLVTAHFNQIDVGQFSAPFLVDIDNDGLIDLLVGELEGTIWHYEQDLINSQEFNLISENFCNIDVGLNSALTIADLDDDGLLDMLIGCGIDNYDFVGNLSHYEQTAANSDQFTLVTDQFLSNSLHGCSCPALVDFNSDGLLDLVIGNSEAIHGNYYYMQAEPASYQFEWQDNDPVEVNGSLIAPAFADLDHDGIVEMVIGHENGYLSLYQFSEVQAEFIRLFYIYEYIDASFLASPLVADIDHNGSLDLLIGTTSSSVVHYEQDTPNSLNFHYSNSEYDSDNYFINKKPEIIDLDSDGLWDLIIGEKYGKLLHYEQQNAGECEFTFITDRFASLDVGANADPTFCDLDSDGLRDLLVGNSSGKIYHLEQNSLGDFELITDNFCNIDVGYCSSPCSEDIDNDGKLDLLIGNVHGNIWHYEQSISGGEEFELITTNFQAIKVEESAQPAFGDIDGDGYKELLVGSFDGGIHLFRHNPEMADFSASETIGYQPFIVQFTDLSQPDITGWEWDFDADGIIDSYEQNPEWLFTSSGFYTILLKVSDGNYQDIERKENYITVDSAEPEINYYLPEINQITVRQDSTVTFLVSASDSDSELQYNWFIDSEDLAQNDSILIYTFEEAGDYEIKSIISDEIHQLEIYWNISVDFVNAEGNEMIAKLVLHQNHPNPFSPSGSERSSSTTISFDLATDSKVTVEIYNVKGQKVKTLVDERLAAGNNSVTWNGYDQHEKKVSSGIYFYKLKTESDSEMKKMMLLK